MGDAVDCCIVAEFHCGVDCGLDDTLETEVVVPPVNGNGIIIPMAPMPEASFIGIWFVDM